MAIIETLCIVLRTRFMKLARSMVNFGFLIADKASSRFQEYTKLRDWSEKTTCRRVSSILLLLQHDTAQLGKALETRADMYQSEKYCIATKHKGWVRYNWTSIDDIMYSTKIYISYSIYVIDSLKWVKSHHTNRTISTFGDGRFLSEWWWSFGHSCGLSGSGYNFQHRII